MHARRRARWAWRGAFAVGRVHDVMLTEGTYKVVVATLELPEEATVELQHAEE